MRFSLILTSRMRITISKEAAAADH